VRVDAPRGRSILIGSMTVASQAPLTFGPDGARGSSSFWAMSANPARLGPTEYHCDATFDKLRAPIRRRGSAP
jgi:hypothetical protein